MLHTCLEKVAKEQEITIVIIMMVIIVIVIVIDKVST